MAIDGGPAVRGNKLLAWRVPAIVKLLNDDKTRERSDDNASVSLLAPPADSEVIPSQRHLLAATIKTLRAVSRDVQGGLRETVGIEAEFILNDRAAVKLKFPSAVVSDPERIARAIDLENVEAWCDEHRLVYVGISPWCTTKDVDQIVLSITKVVHVMLGLHAADAQTPTDKKFAFLRRALSNALDIANLERKMTRK